MNVPSVRFRTTVSGLDPGALAGGFFEGWATPPTLEEHLRILDRASHLVLAFEGDEVIGFATALSDGVLTAYIPLLEVLPHHRGRGIGTELIRRLLAEIGPLYMVDVMCDDDVFPFYEALGFVQAGGGVIRNRAWRSEG